MLKCDALPLVPPIRPVNIVLPVKRNDRYQLREYRWEKFSNAVWFVDGRASGPEQVHGCPLNINMFSNITMASKVISSRLSWKQG